MRHVVVLSPHLDDAVFSVGALTRSLTRRGVLVTGVTVLAGDPDSAAPAGRWDARSGFSTQGEAARRRRDEDRRAWRRLGARAVWLPHADEQYPRLAADSTIAAEITRATADADAVLVPGFPLRHDDHRWLSALASDPAVIEPARLGFYVEQPYAAALNEEPVLPVEAPYGMEWSVEPARARERWAKLRAVSHYRSQHRSLGRHWYRRVTIYEISRGGETVAWPRTTLT